MKFGRCPHCKRFRFLHKVQPATRYYWDGTGEDPNKVPDLCDDCRESYYDYWNEMWREYYSGLGI